MNSKYKHLSYNEIQLLESKTLIRANLGNMLMILLSFTLKLNIIWLQIPVIVLCGIILIYIIRLFIKANHYNKELNYRMDNNIW